LWYHSALNRSHPKENNMSRLPRRPSHLAPQSRIIRAIGIFLMAVSSCSAVTPKDSHESKLKFYGADNQRVVMTFENYLWFQIPDDWTAPIGELLTSPHRDSIDEKINLQLQHMFGVFTVQKDFINRPGVVENTPVVNILSAAKVPGEPFAKITYSYEDTALFHKDVLRMNGNEIRFWLPKDVVGIYAKGIPAGHRKNLCTDEHYNSEGDFWYFWDPDQEGCPIEKKDLVRVTARIRPLPNSRDTYPDYARLYASNGNRMALKVVVMVGIDEDFSDEDLGRVAFNGDVDHLINLGYQVNNRNRRQVTFKNGPNTDYDLDMNIYLVDQNSAQFDELAIDALETADIFVYSGHSGLGGHLAPGRFEDFIGRRIRMPQDKYQILAFQGCSTYAYYNESYFDLKRSASDPSGSKNLDIITAGIGLTFDSGPEQDAMILDSLLSGSRHSWQKIIRDVYAVDPESTALHQINGDEDNPQSANR
jgi:hypothetical protein